LKNKLDRLLVAIDGPAASGKNTLAKQIAKKYQLFHLDSGKLYRYFALQIYQSKYQNINYTKLKQALKKFTLKKLKDKRLAIESVTKIASIISKKKRIRQMLKKIQHDLAYNPPKKFKGSVLDGRDIGTVIIPDAHVKVYLTASLNIRAVRRYKEFKKLGIKTTLSKVKSDIKRRDYEDTHRKISSLKPAKDTDVLLDSSFYNTKTAFVKIDEVIRNKIKLLNATKHKSL
jgi:cytidylate kinase